MSWSREGWRYARFFDEVGGSLLRRLVLLPLSRKRRRFGFRFASDVLDVDSVGDRRLCEKVLDLASLRDGRRGSDGIGEDEKRTGKRTLKSRISFLFSGTSVPPRIADSRPGSTNAKT